MKKSILLLAPFAVLVACFGKEKEAAPDQTVEACQVENITAAEMKSEESQSPAPAAEEAKTA